jgi:hypothetical protein
MAPEVAGDVSRRSRLGVVAPAPVYRGWGATHPIGRFGLDRILDGLAVLIAERS